MKINEKLTFLYTRILIQVDPGNGKLTLLKTQILDTSGSGKWKPHFTVRTNTYTSIDSSKTHFTVHTNIHSSRFRDWKTYPNVHTNTHTIDHTNTYTSIFKK